MTSPSFELHIDTLYEITINPDDRHQYWSSDLRHIKSRADIKDLLCDLPIKYCLWQELSIQQHSNKSLSYNRIHYHGMMTVTDPFAFALTGMYKITRIADYQINNYRINKEFITYSQKQKYLYLAAFPPVKQKLSNCTKEFWTNLME